MHGSMNVKFKLPQLTQDRNLRSAGMGS